MNNPAINMPLMGLGTYGRRDDEGQAAIETALQIGYRNLDTAQDYNTEAQCGAAFAASGLQRSEVFFTTKIKTGNLGAGLAVPSVRESLEIMGIDQADLVLIHWPSPNGEIAPQIYIEQLAEVKALGLARYIGVSNFTVELIDIARNILGENEILTNQVEVHPYLRNRTLTDHCQAHGIGTTCYMPLAQGRIGADPAMQAIAQNHDDATPEQVSLAYLMQQGFAVIPSSANPDRMRANFEAQSLTLNKDEMSTIDTLNKSMRIIDPSWGPKWDL